LLLFSATTANMESLSKVISVTKFKLISRIDLLDHNYDLKELNHLKFILPWPTRATSASTESKLTFIDLALDIRFLLLFSVASANLESW